MSVPQAICVIHNKQQAHVLLQGQRTHYLKLLAKPESATTLAQKLNTPRQKVNYHLRALEDADLIRLVETRKARNCTERVLQATAHQYVLSPDILADLTASPHQEQDRFASAHLIQMAANTIQQVGTLRQKAKEAGKPIATLSLDAGVRFRSAKDRAAFAAEFTQAFSTLLAKYHQPEAENGRDFRIIFGIHPQLSNPTSS